MPITKILFALESFFPTHRAGTEVYVLNLCKYFQSKGYGVSVLIATTAHQADYTYEGISVHTFPIPEKPDARELNGLMPPHGIQQFIKRVIEIKPDLVHFHSFGRAINGYHLKAVKELGIKTAFTPHLGSIFCIKGDLSLYGKENCDGRVDGKRCMACYFNNKGLKKPLAQILSYSINPFLKLSLTQKIAPPALFQAQHRKNEMQRINKYADIIYSIAPWIQEAFKLNEIHKAKLIPQGINTLFFENNKTIEQKKTKSSPIRLGFIGRMFPIKGFHLLMEALDKVKNPNYVLHIITMPSGGEIEYLDSAKIWANNKRNVIWNESLSSQEVKDYYAKIECLILPSINEMAPLASLESLACKTPIICSDIPAFKDQINQYKGGTLYKSGSASDLADKINAILLDPHILEECKNSIQSPHSMDQVAQIIENDYNQLLQPNEQL